MLAPGLILAASLSLAAQAAPPCEVINFDNLAAGTQFGANQPYLATHGVTFSTTCGVPHVQAASLFPGNAPSPPNVFAGPFTDQPLDCCANINFGTPTNWVRLQVAAEVLPANQPQPALIVTAYDCAGGILGSEVVVLTKFALPSGQTFLQWDSVLFDRGPGNCEICRVSVCTLDGALFGVYQFFIDDVEFGSDPTPPIVHLDSPACGECICDGNLLVDGSVCDDFCGDLETELRIRPVPSPNPTTGSPPWNTLVTMAPPPCVSIPGLYAASLPASVYPEGTYLLQMQTTNGCGRSDTDEHIIKIDRNAPRIVVDCPARHQLVNRMLDVVGSITDLCPGSWFVTFGPSSNGLANPVVASGSGNVGPVLASINTASGAYPDGTYLLYIESTDQCGHVARNRRHVQVDNTPPVAMIASPLNCSTQCPHPSTPITGFVADANLAGWKLEALVPAFPLATPKWTVIDSGTQFVGNLGTGTPGSLGFWFNCWLPPCCYQLKLTAWDRAGSCPSALGTLVGPNTTIHEVCFDLGLEGDINHDGVIDPEELNFIFAHWGDTCPQCP